MLDLARVHGGVSETECRISCPFLIVSACFYMAGNAQNIIIDKKNPNTKQKPSKVSSADVGKILFMI